MSQLGEVEHDQLTAGRGQGDTFAVGRDGRLQDETVVRGERAEVGAGAQSTHVDAGVVGVHDDDNDNIDFDYTSVDVNLLFGVRFVSR